MSPMIKIRKSGDRGKFDFGWLKTYHSFSFGQYYDPENMGYQSLRVINDDFIAPGGGFDTHGHRDMEIVTYVLSGELAHKDSLGNVATIKAGEVQRMTAGTGIRHSEFNYSDDDPVHLLQIWILPERQGLTPGYEQRMFSAEDKKGKLKLIASPDGRDGSVKIHQDASIYASILGEAQKLEYKPQKGRHLWLQVASGKLDLDGEKLETGDGAAINGEVILSIKAASESEFLLFDLQ